jgi:hypothetical protein
MQPFATSRATILARWLLNEEQTLSLDVHRHNRSFRICAIEFFLFFTTNKNGNSLNKLAHQIRIIV